MRKVTAIITCGLLLAAFTLAGPRAQEEAQEYRPPLDFDKAIISRLYEALHSGINTHVIWAGNPRYKNIALTFDDGPNSKYTPQVLRVLDEHKVRATFFLIGKEAQRHPESVRQIDLAGHEIGNHTYSHVRLTELSSDAIKRELDRTQEILSGLTGRKAIVFRPPWGLLDSRTLTELAMMRLAVVLWSVDSRDWSRPGAKAIAHNVLSKAQAGSIVLCHDDNAQILEALPEIIETLKGQGYQFITASEMIAISM